MIGFDFLTLLQEGTAPTGHHNPRREGERWVRYEQHFAKPNLAITHRTKTSWYNVGIVNQYCLKIDKTDAVKDKFCDLWINGWRRSHVTPINTWLIFRLCSQTRKGDPHKHCVSLFVFFCMITGKNLSRWLWQYSIM